MIKESLVFIFLMAFLIGLLVYWRRWEERRVRQKTLEAMSPELRVEIEEERRVNREKKEKFEEALKQAGSP